MAGALSRKTVYIGTAVAVVALVAGFAAAALTAPVASTGQNGFGVSAPGDTIYGASGSSQSTSLVWTQATVCSVTGDTVAPASGAVLASVFVSGPAMCQTGSPDWFEEINFTSAAVTSTGPSDLFTITVGSESSISVTVTYSGLTSGTSVVTTSVLYELGPSASATTAAIAINGS